MQVMCVNNNGKRNKAPPNFMFNFCLECESFFLLLYFPRLFFASVLHHLFSFFHSPSCLFAQSLFSSLLLLVVCV